MTSGNVPLRAPGVPVRPRFVRDGETVLWTQRPVLRSMASSIFGLGITFVLALFFVGPTVLNSDRLAPYAGMIIGAVGILFVFILVTNVLVLRRTIYVITDHGAYTRRGLIGESVNQTSFEKITDISYNQDVLGRILSYGTLQVNTAGSTTNALAMPGLSDAVAVKRLLEDARAKSQGRRRQPEPPTFERLDGLPYFTPGDQVALVACAQCSQTYKWPMADAGRRAACPSCGHANEVPGP